MRNSMAVLLAGTILCGCGGGGGGGGTGFHGTSTDSNRSASNGASGNPPPAVLYEGTYVFSPTASDPDGDALGFQIQNKPRWADFDESTGRLSGQPSINDIGIYRSIVITVSDGEQSRSLPAFSIEVTGTALGAVTLSWNPPTQNEDGSALTDLAGYEIHYGRESGNYNQSIRINNPSITTYVVEQLVPGTYYFAATAFNHSGVESSFSGEAVRTLN